VAGGQGAGSASQDTAVPAVRSPARSLGAIIDTRGTAADGAPVLAVTPGSPAERIGLMPGDRLVSFNGQRFDGSRPAATVLGEGMRQRREDLVVQAWRDGRLLTLRGEALFPVAATIASGASACGFVSDRGVHPRVTRDIFPAEITRIDGRSTPLRRVNRHQLDAGPHVLTIAERIDDQHLSSVEKRWIFLTRRFLDARGYKTLIVNVEPDTRLEVGAQLREDRLDSRSIRDNLYWEPVVWQVSAERCP
jgi:membrane-associated protease RseP (regulator of RpoE activity)